MFNKMIFYVLIYSILLLSKAYSTNPAVDQTNHDPEKKTTSSPVSSNNSLKVQQNEAKVALMSEGGAVVPEPPSMTLQETSVNLLNFVKDTVNTTKGNSVKARKGVNSTSVGDKDNQKTASFVSDRIGTTIVRNITTSIKTTTHAPVPKKPLLLSYEALAESDTKRVNAVPKLSNNLDSYVPPLTLEPKKITQTNVNNHPGMILPLVITVLVVPVFAAVGYMALRRGQEAWKNRHYKRMDFLLDGMYND